MSMTSWRTSVAMDGIRNLCRLRLRHCGPFSAVPEDAAGVRPTSPRALKVQRFISMKRCRKRLNDLDIAVELRAKWHDDASFQNYRNASLDRARVRGR